MAQQTINTGTAPNDGTGDPLQTAFNKCNDNFTELYNADVAGYSNISNGTSNVKIASSGSNVTVGVGGTGNVAVFATTGEYVTGLMSVTGNVQGGNLRTTGLVSATGNVNGGNVISAALLQGATLSATGAITFSGTTTDINIGTSATSGNISIGGSGSTGTGFINIGGSIATRTLYIANGAVGTGNTKTVSFGENGVAGSTTNINIGPVTATTAAGLVTFNTATRVAIANTGGTALSVAGNITGGNVLGGANVNATTHTGTTVSVTGNITGGPYLKTSSLTVATLPAAATAGAGARSFVSDATATTFASIVAGSGANAVPVFSDGTNWKIG